MQLGPDEQKLAEYYYKQRDGAPTPSFLAKFFRRRYINISVLTNRRLIVAYGNAEESYPLSKITAIKFVFNRSWVAIVIGIIAAIAGITKIYDSISAGVILLIIGVILIYFGWRGKTQLFISQMGGNKYYKVVGRDQGLQSFIDAVNSRLA